jgi:hypothetical protein
MHTFIRDLHKHNINSAYDITVCNKGSFWSNIFSVKREYVVRACIIGHVKESLVAPLFSTNPNLVVRFLFCI